MKNRGGTVGICTTKPRRKEESPSGTVGSGKRSQRRIEKRKTINQKVGPDLTGPLSLDHQVVEDQNLKEEDQELRRGDRGEAQGSS